MLMRLGEMTRQEIGDCAGHAVILLPIASTEQHGPHLPMLTDTLLVETIVDRACDTLHAKAPTFVRAPGLPIGCSDHHLFAAGMSLGVATLRAVLADLADSLVTTGFQRLFIVNGHGGNDECVRLAVKELVLRRPVAAAACSYWDLAADVDLGPNAPGHAGLFETSLMLSAYPHLVRTDRIPDAHRDQPPRFDQDEVPGLTVQAAGEWARVGGTTDSGSAASAERGAHMLDQLSARLVRALTWFEEHTRDFAQPRNGKEPTA